ncbi:MAG: GvpL/GvpF family gas vesicle protein [Streptosporangiaceae bacterium]|nr:GvpL/GvpF family gas vesicle protein [Streptosporangiaceae bacterium]
MTEPRGVWLYAVAGQVDAAALTGLAGVGGGAVRAVAAGGLTAVAGDVELEEYSEAALRRNLEDMDWLAATARAHHQVIDALARQGPLVPMRLATVYRSFASVIATITARAGDFRQTLDRLGTRKEWGVKAYMADEPAPAAAPGAGPAAGAGTAYLMRRREQLSANQSRRREAAASARTVHGELSRHAAEARCHPPQAPQLSGERAVMVLNAAYLLDEGRATEFAEAVTVLAGRHPSIRLELTGPWPAYSFVGASAEGPGRSAAPASTEN